MVEIMKISLVSVFGAEVILGAYLLWIYRPARMVLENPNCDQGAIFNCQTPFFFVIALISFIMALTFLVSQVGNIMRKESMISSTVGVLFVIFIGISLFIYLYVH